MRTYLVFESAMPEVLGRRELASVYQTPELPLLPIASFPRPRYSYAVAPDRG